MLLAYICNIIMVVFVLDSSFSPDRVARPIELTYVKVLRFGLGKHMWNVPITDLYPGFSIVSPSIIDTSHTHN